MRHGDREDAEGRGNRAGRRGRGAGLRTGRRRGSRGRRGALPVFADIDPHSYCLDAEAVAAVTGPRTAAIVAVHRFGRSAPCGS
ncbi:DegT/DnrJ/EryC1/StrS family aminotransferase [Actinomadura keratinilytica]